MVHKGLSVFVGLMIISVVCGQYFSSHDYSALNRVGKRSKIFEILRLLPDGQDSNISQNYLLNKNGKHNLTNELSMGPLKSSRFYNAISSREIEEIRDSVLQSLLLGGRTAADIDGSDFNMLD